MAKLTIVADIHAKTDEIEMVKTELLELIPFTRAENGYIQYNLHQDNENPAHGMLYKNRERRELWQTHKNAPQLATYMAAKEGAVEAFTLNEMTIVG